MSGHNSMLDHNRGLRIYSNVRVESTLTIPVCELFSHFMAEFWNNVAWLMPQNAIIVL